ncbi:hypothetical protein KY349_02570 [Candidatus Woesearchaeota archaeon]|nr:hypothetical protein [Candidatus Woesearchaeota archaeon]
MESSEDLRERARRSLQVAEQMLSKTYPIVNDPKLILAIAEDIYAALTSSMTALLVKKQEKMQISDDFSSIFTAFQQIAPDLSFQQDDLEIIKELSTIIAEHKDSPVEFPRKDKFIICDNEYKCTTITIDDMKSYLFRARLFVEKVNDALDKEQ